MIVIIIYNNFIKTNNKIIIAYHGFICLAKLTTFFYLACIVIFTYNQVYHLLILYLPGFENPAGCTKGLSLRFDD